MKEYILILWSLLINKDECFNIDSHHPIVMVGSGGAGWRDRGHFGYSLDLAVANDQVNLFVGAPTKDVRGKKTGSVYKCSIPPQQESGVCKPLPLKDQITEDQMLDGQMLGAAMGVVADAELHTCAPRRQHRIEKQFSQSRDPVSFMMMQGKCWKVGVEDTNSVDGDNYLDGTAKFYGRIGFEHTSNYTYGTLYSSLGQSLHISDHNTKQVLFGAPGTFNWTGTLFKKTPSEELLGQPWSKEHPRNDDYAGYSVGSGKFKNSDGVEYILGAPRAGDKRTGEVYLVNFDQDEPIHTKSQKMKLFNQLTAKGRQAGEYFGAAVASVDLDGDGLDDLVVGAPLFTNHEVRVKRSNQKYKKKYEEGRLGVFHNTEGRFKEIFIESSVRLTSGARMGSAVANLGDINNDGCEDIAVGAPGQEGGGAVLVFRGRPKPIIIDSEPMQVIYAKDMKIKVRGFGISFSSAKDIDGNSYNDFAVGSHTSGNAIIFRTQPVVSYSGNLKFDPPSINIAVKSELMLTVCVAVTAKVAYNAMEDINTRVTVNLDNKAEFVGGSSVEVYTVEVPVGGEQCRDINIKTKDTFTPTSSTTPIRATAKFAQVLDDERSRFCATCGRIEPSESAEVSNELPFQTGCENEKCESDLEVYAYIKDHIRSDYVIGSTDVITLIVNVTNKEGGRLSEPAYKPQLTIEYPEYLPLLKNVKECRQQDSGNGGWLGCLLPGPIVSSSHYALSIDFDAKRLFAGIPHLDFNKIEVSSDSVDTDITNNRDDLVQVLRAEVDLEMVGLAEDDVKTFSSDGEVQNTLFMQRFQVRKHLASPVKGVMVDIDVPVGIIYNDKKRIMVEIKDSSVSLSGSSPDQSRCTTLGSTTVTDGQVDLTSLSLNCSTNHVICQKVRCGPFSIWSNHVTSSISVKLNLSAPAVESLLAQMEVTELSVGSSSLVHVPGLDHEMAPHDASPNSAKYNTLFRVFSVVQDSVPLWQIIVSVFGALIVLLLLVVLLVWKTNFFKRKSPKQEEDTVQKDFENHVASPEMSPMMDTGQGPITH